VFIHGLRCVLDFGTPLQTITHDALRQSLDHSRLPFASKTGQSLDSHVCPSPASLLSCLPFRCVRANHSLRQWTLSGPPCLRRRSCRCAFPRYWHCWFTSASCVPCWAENLALPSPRPPPRPSAPHPPSALLPRPLVSLYFFLPSLPCASLF